MSDFKHTPGPWTHDEKDECLIRGEQGRRICWTATASPGDLKGKYASRRQGDEANARLIAAAPELLDALLEAEAAFELTIPLIPEKYDWPGSSARSGLQIVREAIAKATGREPA